MKAFIIHTPHQKSLEYANKVLASFSGIGGWEPRLFEGLTINNLSEFEKKHPLKIKPSSRAKQFHQSRSPLYSTKKCCSMNHYCLFRLCIELNETIAVIEHDSFCIGEWTEPEFDDILVMNAHSALRQPALKHHLRHHNKVVRTGIHDLVAKGLEYRHNPEINGSFMMPGTAAYAVTPRGAQKLISVYETLGWEQSDFMINTAYVRIQTIIPELFTFKLPNLKMSHGRNMR